ncbi:DNA-binding GntR family transcriptional regulator [Klugiella xanthotipulae]|uniref:DNA-binding GntR family transcriptional regulator n=1 Tax=Klugiella xanthotipulae TaxID=244735 RepID=A0A543HH14_9MICO|nr:DNA-binding GntR family transcriptional regulator [Klugiella xanthotipulae]
MRFLSSRYTCRVTAEHPTGSPPAGTTHTAYPPGLADQAAETIRQRLIAGELVPGQQLSEAALSDDLAISRNTLREAFRALTYEGLLTHQHHRGVFVVVPTIASIIDIYRVRRIIECQALTQALPKHPAGERMRTASAEALRLRDAGDWVGVGTANMEFHSAIVSLADSQRLDALYANVSAELRLAFSLLDDPEFLHGPYVDLNTTIDTLYAEGRTAEAGVALNDYLLQSERTVLAAYTRHGA